MLVCTTCGKEWPDDFKLCPNDGSSLRDASDETDIVGSVIADRYHIKSKLGEGGMGAVYLAEHVRMGQEVAIHVYDQNENNQLDSSDYIEFYGRPVTGSDFTKYTDTNIYWLTDSGSVGALRMAYMDGTPGTAPLSDNHPVTVRHEEDAEYFQLAPGADTRDRWYSPNFVLGAGLMGGGNPVDFTLSTNHVDGQGTLTLSMWGFYDTDHEVDVSLNGQYIGTLIWSGITFHQATIGPVNIMDGNNTVTITPVSGDDPQDPDAVIVDWIEADYPKRFVATNDILKFSHDTGFLHQVSGFSTDDLMVFDITCEYVPTTSRDIQTAEKRPGN